MTTNSTSSRKHSAAKPAANVHVMPPASDASPAAAREPAAQANAPQALALKHEEELESRTGRLEALYESLGEGVGSIKQALGSLLRRTDSAEERLQALDARDEALESVTGSLDERTLQVREEVAELSRRAQQAEGRLTGLERGADAARERSEALEQRTQQAEQRIDTLDAGVNALRDTAAGHEAQIGDHQRRLGLLEPGHTALREAHNRLAVQSSALDVRSTGLALRLKRSTVAGGAALGAVALLAAAALWAGLRPEAATSAPALAAIPSLQALEQDVAALQVQLTETGVHAREARRMGAAVEQDVAQIDQRLAAVDTRLSEELSAIAERVYAPEPPAGTAVDLAGVKSSQWLAAQAPGHYVIQLAGVYRKQDLANLIGRHGQALDLERLSYFKTVYRGRDWFVLLYGSFQDYDQALQSLQALPEALQRTGPYVRTFGGVRKSMS